MPEKPPLSPEVQARLDAIRQQAEARFRKISDETIANLDAVKAAAGDTASTPEPSLSISGPQRAAETGTDQAGEEKGSYQESEQEIVYADTNREAVEQWIKSRENPWVKVNSVNRSLHALADICAEISERRGWEKLITKVGPLPSHELVDSVYRKQKYTWLNEQKAALGNEKRQSEIASSEVWDTLYVELHDLLVASQMVLFELRKETGERGENMEGDPYLDLREGDVWVRTVDGKTERITLGTQEGGVMHTLYVAQHGNEPAAPGMRAKGPVEKLRAALKSGGYHKEILDTKRSQTSRGSRPRSGENIGETLSKIHNAQILLHQLRDIYASIESDKQEQFQRDLRARLGGISTLPSLDSHKRVLENLERQARGEVVDDRTRLFEEYDIDVWSVKYQQIAREALALVKLMLASSPASTSGEGMSTAVSATESIPLDTSSPVATPSPEDRIASLVQERLEKLRTLSEHFKDLYNRFQLQQDLLDRKGKASNRIQALRGSVQDIYGNFYLFDKPELFEQRATAKGKKGKEEYEAFLAEGEGLVHQLEQLVNITNDEQIAQESDKQVEEDFEFRKQFERLEDLVFMRKRIREWYGKKLAKEFTSILQERLGRRPIDIYGFENWLQEREAAHHWQGKEAQEDKAQIVQELLPQLEEEVALARELAEEWNQSGKITKNPDWIAPDKVRETRENIEKLKALVQEKLTLFVRHIDTQILAEDKKSSYARRMAIISSQVPEFVEKVISLAGKGVTLSHTEQDDMIQMSLHSIDIPR